jgi:hypothetical protein
MRSALRLALRSALRSALRRALLLALTAASFAPNAHAQLANRDFLAAGDRLLVSDAATGFEWLTPVYTRNLRYGAAPIQALEAQHGFRYATATEVRSMLVANFNNPPTEFPGTEDGFAIADQFFSFFGIALDTRCLSGEVACPRTQGLTSTVGPTPGTHLAFGMIQFDIWGRMIADNPWSDSSADEQLGSWLVRPTAVTTAPEPSTVLLTLAGLSALVFARRRRRAPAV